jgi:hypothetical protein
VQILFTSYVSRSICVAGRQRQHFQHKLRQNQELIATVMLDSIPPIINQSMRVYSTLGVTISSLHPPPPTPPLRRGLAHHFSSLMEHAASLSSTHPSFLSLSFFFPSTHPSSYFLLLIPLPCRFPSTHPPFLSLSFYSSPFLVTFLLLSFYSSLFLVASLLTTFYTSLFLVAFSSFMKHAGLPSFLWLFFLFHSS